MELVFVYGTLRRGGVRAIERLFPAAIFVGAGIATGSLWDFGAYPGFVARTDGGHVIGEVYGVDDAALSEMDEIERIADDWYRRSRVRVTLPGKRLRCWVYEVNAARFALEHAIPNGDWITHAAAKGALPPERWPDAQEIRHGICQNEYLGTLTEPGR